MQKTNKPVSLEDARAVDDLLARYCWHFDENEAEAWADLYTADGVFEGFGPPVVGTAALRAVPGAVWARSQGMTRHAITNLYLEHFRDDNLLVAKFYSQVSDWSQGGKLTMLGLCTAQLERLGGQWKIRHNQAKFLGV